MRERGSWLVYAAQPQIQILSRLKPVLVPCLLLKSPVVRHLARRWGCRMGGRSWTEGGERYRLRREGDKPVVSVGDETRRDGVCNG